VSLTILAQDAKEKISFKNEATFKIILQFIGNNSRE
jgi:hypothetical protein